MEYKAVDIVLLPPEEIMDLVVRMNRGLRVEGERGIVLDTASCIPHITLAMKALSTDDIETAKVKLDARARENAPFALQISQTKSEPISSHQTVSMLVVEKTKELQRLHEAIMNDLAVFDSPEPTVAMFAAPPAVSELPSTWVKGFEQNWAFVNFFPHITLGLGDVTDQVHFPMSFTASRLAMCHLGNYCTCRKIIYEVRLV